MLKQLEKINNRRKAVIWVSNGYDFNPFEDSRLGEDPCSAAASARRAKRASRPNRPVQAAGNQFADADLARELAEVTRSRQSRQRHALHDRPARPRRRRRTSTRRWTRWSMADYVRKTQDSLRVLAEETGGIAVVNQNDFDKALKRIDAETSDYYVLGYYSTNPDPLKRTRKIEVKLTKPGSTCGRARRIRCARRRTNSAEIGSKSNRLQDLLTEPGDGLRMHADKCLPFLFAQDDGDNTIAAIPWWSRFWEREPQS